MPGFIITGEPRASATGYTWAARRSLDDHHFSVKILAVADLSEAKAAAAQQVAALHRIESTCVIRQHGAIALADGTLALVLDEVTGGSLTQVLGARGQLTPGETVTTVAPLFRALADLHAAGVVHGDLAPGNVLFTADGRPLLSDLGVGRLSGTASGPAEASGSFVAPELVGGLSAASPASDVYAMAALGWLCLVGTTPAPDIAPACLTALRPEVPLRLAEVLASCLAADPATRPSAAAAAVEVFDSAPAESVALASMSDPAAEITRRIRAAAAPAPAVTPPTAGRLHPRALVVGAVVLVMAVLLGSGAGRFLRHEPTAVVPGTASSTPTVPANLMQANPVQANPMQANPVQANPVQANPVQANPVQANPVPATSGTTAMPTNILWTSVMFTRPRVVLVNTPEASGDVLAAPDSPRLAATRLLQSLVDVRALAYVGRNPDLLDLVYAPGSPKADLDKHNIATALGNGATYLGLSFVITNAAFLDGTSDTARIRATIITPAYKTGQPDGRRVSHERDLVGPCVFTLRLTQDGWRILGLTAS